MQRLFHKLSVPLAALSVMTIGILIFCSLGLRMEGTGPCCGVPADFKAIESSLKTYRLNAGVYPTTEQGLAALVDRPTTKPFPRRWWKVADHIPKDPWGSPYEYRLLDPRDSKDFEIVSAGKDGIFGTEDDHSSRNPEHREYRR